MKLNSFGPEWKETAKPFLMEAFKNFKPRAEFLKKNSEVRDLKLGDEEQANILEVRTSFHEYTNKLADFDEVFKTCEGYDSIRQTMDMIIGKVSQEVTKAGAVFVTFASDITGATMGIRHLHPKMNGDHCNVWSFALPLYIGKNAPSFDIHLSEKAWHPRYYLDYSKIRDLNLDYMKLVMPMDGSIFNMQFDGSKHPHVITYSDSIFMWFVFDGIEFKDKKQVGTTLKIGYLT